MSRFQPSQLSQRTTNLVIGTSRTKYINSKEVGAAVHSYRDATLLELCNIVERYPNQKINTLILEAGISASRDAVNSFEENWKFSFQLVYSKFNPSQLITPKTIATSNNQLFNRKINKLIFAFYNLLTSLNLPIVSPQLNRDFDHKIFSSDGIQFSRFGNFVFTQILKFYINLFSCRPIKQLTTALPLKCHQIKHTVGFAIPTYEIEECGAPYAVTFTLNAVVFPRQKTCRKILFAFAALDPKHPIPQVNHLP